MGKVMLRYTVNAEGPGDGTGKLIWPDAIRTPSMGVPTYASSFLWIPDEVKERLELPTNVLEVTKVEDKRFTSFGEQVVKIYSKPHTGPFANVQYRAEDDGHQIYIRWDGSENPVVLAAIHGPSDRRINRGDQIDFPGHGFYAYNAEMTFFDADGNFTQRHIYVM